MEDDVAALRERVEALERRLEHVQGLVDRIDTEVGSIQAREDTLVMPLLLRLGGDAYRSAMLRWLDQAIREQEKVRDYEGEGGTDLLRLRHWQLQLRKREPWPDVPAGGWSD